MKSQGTSTILIWILFLRGIRVSSMSTVYCSNVFEYNQQTFKLGNLNMILLKHFAFMSEKTEQNRKIQINDCSSP